MKKVLVMSLIALVVMTMSSCMRVKLGENGWSLINKYGHHNDTPTQVHQVNQETQMQPFDGVDVSGPFNVILEQGQASTVRVDGTTDQLANMTIYVEGGNLVIDMKEDMVDSGKFFKGMRIFVSSPSVKSIEIAGSGTVTAPNALAVADLGLEIAGSGDITLAQLTCKDLSMEIAGSGDITLGTVQANEASGEIAGSGDIEVAGLICKNVKNQIAGSGDITLNNLQVGHVKSEIAGSGNVILRGKADSHDEEIVGSGKVDVSGLKN